MRYRSKNSGQLDIIYKKVVKLGSNCQPPFQDSQREFHEALN